MKRIGLIGGVSPESTEVYVRCFNRGARARLGGEHSASFIVWHLDYGVMISLYRARDWRPFDEEVRKAGEGLKRAGADALMICSNTTHRAAGLLADATGVKVIHLLDVLAQEMISREIRRPLLLGTIVTMAGDFYRAALAELYDGEIITPSRDDQAVIEKIIIEELCFGVVLEESRFELQKIIAAYENADAVILGCTELCLILDQDQADLPVLDTTALHAEAGLRFAFGEDA